MEANASYYNAIQAKRIPPPPPLLPSSPRVLPSRPSMHSPSPVSCPLPSLSPPTLPFSPSIDLIHPAMTRMLEPAHRAYYFSATANSMLYSCSAVLLVFPDRFLWAVLFFSLLVASFSCAHLYGLVPCAGPPTLHYFPCSSAHACRWLFSHTASTLRTCASTLFQRLPFPFSSRPLAILSLA